MNEFEVVGFNQFVSRKGPTYINIFVKYEDSRVQGIATDKFFIPPERVSGELQVGCHIRVTFGRNNYVASIEVID